jgi:regulatory protein RepA
MNAAFKIFPATLTSDRRKIPLIKDWKTLASDDPTQIKKWMEQYKERITHWALPTGPINNLLVLDVDIKGNGWKSVQENSLYIPETMTQKTMSGGSHFLFKYPHDGREYGNKVGLYPGVDVRGLDGYVFYYGTDQRAIVEAPPWLISSALKIVPEAQGPTIKIAPEIAKGMIDASFEEIVNAPDGESNNILNKEAFRMGQLVASGSITRADAEAMLWAAAMERKKPRHEAQATIKSGLDGGLVKPMTSPFGEPVASFPLPTPPSPPGRWTPQLLTKADLLNSSKLKKPQLFEDWSSEDITITTADGGTGKTTLKLFEAVCLALGDRFLGFNCKQKGKTLFITGEDTDKKLAAMLGAIVRQMGLFENTEGNNEKIQTILDSIVIKKDSDLCLIQKDRQGFLHLNSDSLRKVLEAIHDINPKMVVFDPISSFWGSESALNDMNKAVIKFMSELVENSQASIEMINHLGKQSSSTKDMTQFAGRGGSGLPSNSRISRTMRQIFEDEYHEMTGEYLGEKQTAILCNVNKYTDGSPLFNKPFIILREGYLFSRKTLTPAKAKEAQDALSDLERIFNYVKEERAKNKYPSKSVVMGHFMHNGDPISKNRIDIALKQLVYGGLMGERLKEIPNPDMTVRDKGYVILDVEGKEL